MTLIRSALRAWMEEDSQKKAENEAEYRESISEQLRTIREENKDLKERVHELQLGQKILPTREEMSEEITNQRERVPLFY